jgi:hypothetical protein
MPHCFDNYGEIICEDDAGRRFVPDAALTESLVAAQRRLRERRATTAVPQAFSADVEKVSAAVVEARLAVCGACPKFEAGKCMELSCRCSVRGMAELVASTCPKGLWPVVPAPAPRTVDAPQPEEGQK